MGLEALVGKTRLAMMSVVLVAAGCQQTAPMRLSVASDDPGLGLGVRRPAELKDTPYVNPNWREDDGPVDPIDLALTVTNTAISSIFDPLVDGPTRSVEWLQGDRPSKAAKLLEDHTSPDNRRIGMNKLADFGFLHRDIFDKRCRQIAEDDADFTVRATAIRTENRARDGKATAVFIRGLTDHSEWVRLESAKALANIPDLNAAEALVAMLNDREESRDVRVAAADALKHYRTLPVIRALTSTLNDKTFVVGWQARRSLRYLTTRDFGYDAGAWLAYFTGPQSPLG